MYRKILLYLFCFLYSISIYAQSDDAMVLVFERAYPWSMDDISLQFGGNVDVTIDWGGGEIENINAAGNYTHSLTLENGESVDTVRITGNVDHFSCGGGRYPNYLQKVLTWGNLGLKDLSEAFVIAWDLISVPDSIPKGVTNLSGMFMYNRTFNGDISGWDVSNVTDMSYMFREAQNFNSDISGWDVSNVTDMSYMFCEAYDFNADISTWDVSQVTNMRDIFNSASSLEADISGWDISNVTDMSGMFAANRLKLANISSWDVSKVTSMSGMFFARDLSDCDLSNWDISSVKDMSVMFAGASNFDFIGNWDVSNVTNMRRMFEYCSNLKLPIDSWNVSNVKNMSKMFKFCQNIDVDISSWDVSKVTKMDSMFFGAANFDLDLSSWDVSNVTSMSYMFYDVENLTLDLSKWDVSNVTNMSGMFWSAGKFNADISKWNVSNVTAMDEMFSEAYSFNIDISSWDVSNVTTMYNMFCYANKFNQDISKWNVSNVTNMLQMFRGAKMFDQDLGKWDVSNVTDMRYMFSEDTLSTDNYSNMLTGWAKLQLQNNVEFSGGYSQYNNKGAAARQKIIDTYGWTISDGGLVAPFQLFTAKLVDSSIVLNWKVDAEINDSGFAVERRYIVSDDTSTWDQIYKVSSDSSLSYSYSDSNLPSADVVHYRLFGQHEDGQVIISDTLIVDISSLTGIELKEGLATEFFLQQNYPNPFNPTTIIEYSILESEEVTLKVYDMLGREIMTLVNKVQPAGNYSVTFDASELASGIYVYRLSAGDFVSTKKMVLLK